MSKEVIQNTNQEQLPVNFVGGTLLEKKPRESGIELFRIITMILIVMHHYVVNTGIWDLLSAEPLSFKSIFFYVLGGFGKPGINCFVLITGYFMCKSNITLKKFLKLFLEVLFYYVIITLAFTIAKYPSNWSFAEIVKGILPVISLTQGFTSCYLVFFLFIPFLNILIKNMTERTHGLLILLCLVVFSVLPCIPTFTVTVNYVFWFMVIYVIGAYIRLYRQELFARKKLWTLLFIASTLLCVLSIVGMTLAQKQYGVGVYLYHFMADCNKILPVLFAVSGFVVFKNLNMKPSRIINAIASTCFGVLIIHTKGDAMRLWLWGDLLQNVKYFGSNWAYLHIFLSTIIVFTACMLIDLARIYLIEKPLFKWMDKKFFNKKKKEENQ